MGWKALKEHYHIDHIVQVTEAGVCIGSGFVHDLQVVKPDGTVVLPHEFLGRNEKLDRYRQEMGADPGKVREILAAPDSFARSITVYTYDGADIIEKQCEEAGWPNITHDGEIMYENMFSTDRAEVVEWAKRNASAGVEICAQNVVEFERKLGEARARLEKCERDLRKLEGGC